MSGSSKVDIAAMATSGILTVDQIMKALEASHEGKDDHAKKHLGYAAVGAAVAVGALELLRRDERNKRLEEDSDSDYDETDKHDKHGHHHGDEMVILDDHHGHHRGDKQVVIVDPRSPPHHNHHGGIMDVFPRSGRDHTPSGHRRRLAEEIVGAYALGQEIMGHQKHHVAHVVAEVLGAVAALKDYRDHVQGVE